jgi:hypothetical protein
MNIPVRVFVSDRAGEADEPLRREVFQPDAYVNDGA